MSRFLTILRAREPGGGWNRQFVFAFLLTAMVATGLYNHLAPAPGPAFRVNLFFHPILGVLMSLWLVQSIFERLRARVKGLSHSTGLALAGIVFLALLRAYTLKYLPIDQSNRIAAAVFVSIALLGVFVLRRLLPHLSAMPRDRSTLSLTIMLVLWFLAAGVGVLIVARGGGRGATMLFEFHASVGYFAGVAGLVALVVPHPSRIHRSGVLHGSGIALLLCVGLVTLVTYVSAHTVQAPPLAAITVHLSTEPVSAGEGATRSGGPLPIDAGWLRISRSCGGGECHAGILDDAQRSLHAISLRPAHVRKTLDLLIEEIGRPNERMCAGCHAPAELARGGGAIGASPAEPGVGCVVCHAMVAVEVDPGQRSSYRLALDRDVLEPFLRAEREGGTLDGRARLMIALNPAAHGRAFTKPLLRDDQLCQACHHLQLARDLRADPCVTCHMTQRAALGREGVESSHLFLGANSITARLVGDGATADLASRWARGDMLARELTDLYGPELAPPIEFGDRALAQFRYLDLGSSLEPSCDPSREVSFEVVTKNLGGGHAFPSGSLDLLEAWIEVRVQDERGATLFESGVVRSDGSLPTDARTFGGLLRAHDGAALSHYRVWVPHERVVVREVPYRGQTIDRFRFRVPDTAGRYLNVTSRLLYRKLGYSYWRWAYPEVFEIPTLELARHFTQYDSPCGAAARDQATDTK